jgi:hypothetical protein
MLALSVGLNASLTFMCCLVLVKTKFYTHKAYYTQIRAIYLERAKFGS